MNSPAAYYSRSEQNKLQLHNYLAEKLRQRDFKQITQLVYKTTISFRPTDSLAFTGIRGRTHWEPRLYTIRADRYGDCPLSAGDCIGGSAYRYNGVRIRWRYDAVRQSAALDAHHPDNYKFTVKSIFVEVCEHNGQDSTEYRLHKYYTYDYINNKFIDITSYPISGVYGRSTDGCGELKDGIKFPFMDDPRVIQEALDDVLKEIIDLKGVQHLTKKAKQNRLLQNQVMYTAHKQLAKDDSIEINSHKVRLISKYIPVDISQINQNSTLRVSTKTNLISLIFPEDYQAVRDELQRIKEHLLQKLNAQDVQTNLSPMAIKEKLEKIKEIENDFSHNINFEIFMDTKTLSIKIAPYDNLNDIRLLISKNFNYLWSDSTSGYHHIMDADQAYHQYPSSIPYHNNLRYLMTTATGIGFSAFGWWVHSSLEHFNKANKTILNEKIPIIEINDPAFDPEQIPNLIKSVATKLIHNLIKIKQAAAHREIAHQMTQSFYESINNINQTAEIATTFYQPKPTTPAE